MSGTEDLKRELDSAMSLGKKKFKSYNNKSVVAIWGPALLLMFAGELTGMGVVALLAICSVVTYFSVKEDWRIRRYEVTGKKEPIDYIIKLFGVT